ncbi:MAG: DNA-binding response regulator [Cyclobacteriaceae bacterium]|nr:MAG: DNA-binding response regulator [Cyclobacteriaceae bacterium]
MKHEQFKILIVDDEKDILELLKYNLEKEGYKIKATDNGISAVEIADSFIPNIILLDIMMPGRDGVETCRILRLNSKLVDTHIIFLTARSEEYSEVAAFEVGADDYITKPIKPRALLSRIKALYKKAKNRQNEVPIVNVGNLIIDRTSYSVKQDDQEITLPKKEFELLYFLAQSPNKVFNREELLNKVWGSDVYVLARTVDVHIRKVREKIGEDYISTIKGVGYKFNHQ